MAASLRVHLAQLGASNRTLRDPTERREYRGAAELSDASDAANKRLKINGLRRSIEARNLNKQKRFWARLAELEKALRQAPTKVAETTEELPGGLIAKIREERKEPARSNFDHTIPLPRPIPQTPKTTLEIAGGESSALRNSVVKNGGTQMLKLNLGEGSVRNLKQLQPLRETLAKHSHQLKERLTHNGEEMIKGTQNGPQYIDEDLN